MTGRLGLVAALVLAFGAAAAPVPAAAQSRPAAALAPDRSLVPPVRPLRPALGAGRVAGVVAGPQGLVRAPPRPAPGAGGPAPAAQVPANMVPVGTAGQAPAAPTVDLAVALALESPAFADQPPPSAPRLAVAVTEGPGPLRPAPRGIGSTRLPGPVLVAGAAPASLPPPVPRPSRQVPARPAPDAARLAALPADLAPPPDPRAVARSLRPSPRTAAARRRFEAAVAALAARRQRPPVMAAAPSAPPQPIPARAVAEPSTGGLCGAAGLEGRRLPRIASQVAGCGIDEPVSLTRVHGIRLNPPATLHCDAARATGRWVRDVAIPAIGRQGGGLVELRLGSHYACRPRNNQRGARISEHGRGRAIDISGFRLANGEVVTVLRDYGRGPWSQALRRMRSGACGIYSTTLGPGSDRFHSDHFHFDVAAHRGGGSYCR